MERHSDFQKIYSRFVKTYGDRKGESLYSVWIEKKSLDDTKPLKNSKEKKEKMCIVRGFEVKETELDFHVEGLIATDHIDALDSDPEIEIPDLIPKETLESFADQINSLQRARLMGIHHSEGRPINPEYFGEADVENTPAEVVSLQDGHWGLYVDTKLLKNDPETPSIIDKFRSKELNSFSITYDTKGFETTDFDWIDDKLVRIVNPPTELWGYTGASNPVNPNAIATNFGFKEFKEILKKPTNKEGDKMEVKEDPVEEVVQPEEKVEETKVEENVQETKEKVEEPEEKVEEITPETKEFLEFKKHKKELENKEFIEKTAQTIVDGVLTKMEIKEKVIKDNTQPGNTEIPLEIKEFREILENKPVELKEQFKRAANYADKIGVSWDSTTARIEQREFKSFCIGANGRDLEFKGLGITTNQNTDTDYLQSTAELQDVYDPVIYNALNQRTVLWNILRKDDMSNKGNNQVQFVLKTAANTSAEFYTGNAVTLGNVTRLKYQTKFKKIQVGVSVDGDMIAAARGGPVSDVFAQEVMDSTMDMLAVINAALFAEVGLETAAAVIGLEYITDSANNTTLYNVTRSSDNKLAPDSAGDTYIDQGSARISMTNLRAGIRQGVVDGADKQNFIYVTSPLQGDLLRSKFDDSRRMLSPRDTGFGFSTDLFIDGVPVFEDKDCNTDDWWMIDLDSHRVAIWKPATIERLGKSADSEDAFIKMYFATYNRRPRALVQIYGCATS